MRSRFTAHVLGDYRHLHRTYLGTADRPYVEEPDAGAMQWTRLVVHLEEMGPKPNTGYVDFSAYYQDAGVEHALHEKSEFTQRDGTWFYARTIRMGPAPVKSTTPKIGRNDPCVCGSGKKYKHCCGR
jgi:SEC-C motif domain protein